MAYPRGGEPKVMRMTPVELKDREVWIVLYSQCGMPLIFDSKVIYEANGEVILQSSDGIRTAKTKDLFFSRANAISYCVHLLVNRIHTDQKLLSTLLAELVNNSGLPQTTKQTFPYEGFPAPSKN